MLNFNKGANSILRKRADSFRVTNSKELNLLRRGRMVSEFGRLDGFGNGLYRTCCRLCDRNDGAARSSATTRESRQWVQET